MTPFIINKSIYSMYVYMNENNLKDFHLLINGKDWIHNTKAPKCN